MKINRLRRLASPAARWVAATAAMTLMSLATPAGAQEIRIETPAYSSWSNAVACTVGDCADYAPGQKVQGVISLNAPLPPNAAGLDIKPLIAAIQLNDGPRNFTLTPGFVVSMAFVSTDAAGVITYFQFQIQRIPGPPYLANLPNDPNSRISGVTVTPLWTSTYSNGLCRQRYAAPWPTEACDWIEADSHSSTAFSNSPPTITYVAAPTPAVVPTLTEWAMILFALLLAGGAALHLQRRRNA
ncbi:MAG: IPTL-CTERM sorting domain-containing protein [Brevundimonas sp.]|uniref:IPTL-CTERM sorting domain-containing protein n=1 Tax=Brevundimonas sp. TaxID=1871086 RepID=UPI0025C2E33F|nr:IPTL-CTERM sorting domain-containing protein [Brevundimonas sp.]MBX3477443.1 IPTL-CTERM sorting domain-containing protein [Brevundimonas sp.]